jgi:hypothetical protein
MGTIVYLLNLLLVDRFVLRWYVKLMGYVSQNELRYEKFATSNASSTTPTPPHLLPHRSLTRLALPTRCVDMCR